MRTHRTMDGQTQSILYELIPRKEFKKARVVTSEFLT